MCTPSLTAGAAPSATTEGQLVTVHLAPTEAVARYVQFWNAETAHDQRRIAADVFTDGIEYHAVPAVLTGTEALIDFRAQFTAHMGRVTYRARTTPDHHHDRARLRWEILLADGGSFATGTDVMELAPDGRIASVTAFLDRAPDGFDQHEHDEAAAG
jgi:hypothetical protein